MKKQSLVVQVDGEVVLEYDRRKPLNKRQREDLSRIDSRLSADTKAGEQSDTEANPLKFTEIVACALVRALQTNNDQVTAASCAWLANRIPELTQVKAKIEDGEHISVELVFNRGYLPEQTVHFVPRLH